MKSYRHPLLMAALLCAAMSGIAAGRTAAAHVPQKVLCTTFPIYHLALHVTEGRGGIETGLMLPAQLGCPHDYVLTPQDMQKLAGADVLITNGLGLEEFLGAPVKQANPDVILIDTSAGIEDVLTYTDDHGHEGEASGDPHREKHSPSHAHSHESAAHAHHGVNPHLFASPRMAAKIVMNIAAGLSKIDPDGAATYFRNATAYAGRLTALADEFAAAGKILKNNQVITQHGVFDYLARDMGLTIIAVVQSHAGQEPSAAEMIELVKTIREKSVGAVFTEPQYPPKFGQTLAKETGIASAVLDPVATGPDDAGSDYYETVMRRNLSTLAQVLGTR